MKRFAISTALGSLVLASAQPVLAQDADEPPVMVIEQADDQTVRAFGVTALTECAVTASRWRRLMGETPVTVAFPGGSE